jgi:hypothetical protein
MFAARSQASPRPEPEILAPRWHTYALIALMVAVAAVGTLLDRRGEAVSAPAESGRIAGVYLPMLLVQWGLFFYVVRVGRPRSALRGLLGPRWAIANGLAADLAWAVLLALIIEASELTFGRSGASPNAALLTILPRTGVERLVWAFVAVSVGICEEVVYRGYLQTQLQAFTGRPWIAIAVQAALFGIALEVLARSRRSLLPCMVCHVGIDLVSALLAHPMPHGSSL